MSALKEGFQIVRKDTLSTRVPGVLNVNSIGNGLIEGDVAANAANNTRVLQQMNAYVNALGGGLKVVFPTGTYVIGVQDFAGQTGLSYSYRTQDMIRLTGCTKHVTLSGYGTKLKLAPGLKYGGFDPVTGLLTNDTSGNFDNAADTGTFIRIQNNNSIKIEGFELDGNDENVVVGGEFGPAGRQIGGSGIWAYDQQRLVIDDVYGHSMMLDGLTVGSYNLTWTSEARPHSIRNSRFEYCARQGMSVISAKGMVVENTIFSHTGRGVISTPPTWGVDLEPDDPARPVQDITFINCEFFHHAGGGLIADTATGSVDRINVIGGRIGQWGTSKAVYPNAKNIRFINVDINGRVLNPFAPATAPYEGATKFIGGQIRDTPHPTHGSITGELIERTGGGGLVFDGVEIISESVRPIYITSAAASKVHSMRNCIVRTSRNPSGSSDFAGILNGVYIEDTTFHDAISAPLANYHWDGGGGTVPTAGRNVKTVGGNVVWGPNGKTGDQLELLNKTVAHNSANFTASGTGVWTVDAADQLYFHYALSGDMMTISFGLNNTTVSGGPANLIIKIPDGFKARYRVDARLGQARDNGTEISTAMAIVIANTSEILIAKDSFNTAWAASTNATRVFGQLTIPVY